MRPCLENAVLRTMSTIVGWSLWPQKINEERKEEKKKKAWGPSPSAAFGSVHHMNETF